MSDAIKLEFRNGPERLKIVMPKDEKLLKRALLVLGLDKMPECVNNDVVIDDSLEVSKRFPMKLSFEMRHNQKFSILFKKYLDSYEQRAYRCIRVENIKHILIDTDTKTSKISINKGLWKEKIKAIGSINESKIKQILIHIKGEIEKDDGQAIIDLLNQRFENIPAKAFFTNNGSDITLLEIIFFGNGIKQKTSDDFFGNRFRDD